MQVPWPRIKEPQSGHTSSERRERIMSALALYREDRDEAKLLEAMDLARDMPAPRVWLTLISRARSRRKPIEPLELDYHSPLQRAHVKGGGYLWERISIQTEVPHDESLWVNVFLFLSIVISIWLVLRTLGV